MSVEIVLHLNGVPVPVVLDDDALAAIAAALQPASEAPPEPSPYLSVAEAAEWLRTSRGAVDDLLSAGKLARHKVGRRTLIARADLQALVQADPRRRTR